MSTTFVPTISAKQAEKKHQFISVFAECTQKVFSTMLGWDVVLKERSCSRGFWSKYDVSGVIGFSGKIRGTLVVSCDAAMTFAAVESFVGSKPTEVTEDVIDLVGELTNMIGGSSKDNLGIKGIDIGLPAVVSGRGHQVSFQPSAYVEILQFTSDEGPFTVEIGLHVPSDF